MLQSIVYVAIGPIWGGGGTHFGGEAFWDSKHGWQKQSKKGTNRVRSVV